MTREFETELVEALHRIGAGMESLAAAQREWTAANKDIIEGRIENDVLSSIETNLRIIALRRQEEFAKQDAEAKGIVMDALRKQAAEGE